MLYYHRTSQENARSILKTGFHDGEGKYLTDRIWKGVWVSDRPLDSNEGAEGEALLEIHIPENEVSPFEWAEKERPYREFLVPARVLNEKGIIVLQRSS
jgi:hypothetical protein